MTRWLRKVGDFFESRLELKETLGPLLRHPVPQGVNWWYVFGSATLTLFLVQIVTGALLAMFFTPSADAAYDSLRFLNQEVALGWLLRAVHNVAGSGMIVMVGVHAVQVFLFGAYKYPRELTWLVGVVLLMLTLVMGFSGQVLRWDSSAYWGVGVLAAMMGRVPWIGPALVRIVLGGPYIGGGTLSRFFSLHVFLVPGLILLFVGAHLYLVVKRGISEPPVPGRLHDPDTYDAHYREELERGEPFYPRPFMKDAVFAGLTVLVVVIVAAIVGPQGPGAPPDPSVLAAKPRPDWYFLSLFALLALVPPSLETVIMLALPVVLVVALAVVPFVYRRSERAPRRRPVSVLAVAGLLGAVGVLTWLGEVAPWAPHMLAWSGTPVPEDMVKSRSPLELQGAVVLQQKDCRNCHALEGRGGLKGPSLDGVATRLSKTELIRQVVQGSGEMPAYGKKLSPAEIAAVVAFLQTLEPQTTAAAPARAVAESMPEEE